MIDLAPLLESAGPVGAAVLILYWRLERVAKGLERLKIDVTFLEYAVYEEGIRRRYRRIKKE